MPACKIAICGMMALVRSRIRIMSLKTVLLLGLWTIGLMAQSKGPLPGMPAPLDPKDIYAADRPGNLVPAVRNFPSRVYVPNTESNTVTVIDPATYKVIET